MHINVHTLTHIYMRENIYIYQVIHHQSARDTLRYARVQTFFAVSVCTQYINHVCHRLEQREVIQARLS
jgi:hypothetical protein